ncbi:unnamed protein product [Anisakis simplex]|uniref:DDE_Tnp_1_7 domain-containing protein n=1 Tax=Anisakis simplex TaxID=6269 RepID=A0A0M3JEN1_ANISI|nr:unnamed protein product [Anisakis simplex]
MHRSSDLFRVYFIFLPSSINCSVDKFQICILIITNFSAAMDVKLCKLILGDRPIHVTLQRALGSLSFFQKLKLFYHIILSHESSITQEEIERCKKSDLLEELLKEMAGEFPMLSKIFVDERDLYMTDTLHTVLRRSTFDKRVAWTKTDGWDF